MYLDRLSRGTKMGGFGELTDQERTDLEAEFKRLETEIEDLKGVRYSPENKKQISEKSARLREISVKLKVPAKR